VTVAVVALAAVALALANVPGLAMGFSPGPYDNPFDGTGNLVGVRFWGYVVWGIPAYILGALIGSVLLLPLALWARAAENRSGRAHARSFGIVAAGAVSCGALGVATALWIAVALLKVG
jgi:hypothetical protein